jgi:hypothetical protein
MLSLTNIVRDKVLNSPNLANIDLDFVKKSCELINHVTKPNEILQFISVKNIKQVFINFTGEDFTLLEANLLKKTIFQILAGNQFIFGSHYIGDINIASNGNVRANEEKVVVSLNEIPWLFGEVIKQLPDLFESCQQFQVDFGRVLIEVMAITRRAYEEVASFQREKAQQTAAARHEKNLLCQDLIESGVTPTFGLTGPLEKRLLGVIVPGAGSQRRKIQIARNDNTYIPRKGCCNELNPVEQGLRTYAIGMVKRKANSDFEFNTSSDIVRKRARVNEFVDEVCAGVEQVVQRNNEGLSQAEVYRYAYSPDHIIQLNAIQNI